MVKNLTSQNVEVTLSCETLAVSRSGYYAWADHPKSNRTIDNQKLLGNIRQIYDESRQTYGSPRITKKLNQEGITCSENRVARLMASNNIISSTVKQFKVKTTDSNHDLPIADRLFQIESVQSTVLRPNQIWASDITYVRTGEGWLYLAIFLDIFTRKIVGHATADHMKTALVLEALDMALGRQNISQANIITHSDRGSQYAAQVYRDQLTANGLQASMSRKGNCYDNAFAESFFHTLKMELIYQRRFNTKLEAKQAIFEFIEVFYNRQRIHSSLGFKTPMEYELSFAA